MSKPTPKPKATTRLKQLFDKEMSRKDFLSIGAIATISLLGVGGVIEELLSHASTPYSSTSASKGVLTGNAKSLAITGAASGNAVEFETPTATATPPTSSTNPSGIPLPTQATSPEGWDLVMADDFDWTCKLGQFPGSPGIGNPSTPSGSPYPWYAYADGTGDQTGGEYYPSEVISVGDSIMNFYLHVNSNGVRCGAAPLPQPPGFSSVAGHLYGRYSICWYCDPGTSGWHAAWLQWPDDENWPENGEIDFPECDINEDVGGFLHVQGGTSGSDQVGTSWPSGSTPQEFEGKWNVATLVWSPGSCQYIINGVTILNVTGSQVPDTSMHWVIQTQANGDAAVPGNVKIDWIAVWIPS